MTQKKAAVDHQ